MASTWFFITIGILMALSPLPIVAVIGTLFLIDQELGVMGKIRKFLVKEKPKEKPKEAPKEKPKEKPKEVPKEAPKEKPKEKPKKLKDKVKKLLKPNLPEYRLVKVKPGEVAKKK